MTRRRRYRKRSSTHRIKRRRTHRGGGEANSTTNTLTEDTRVKAVNAASDALLSDECERRIPLMNAQLNQILSLADSASKMLDEQQTKMSNIQANIDRINASIKESDTHIDKL